MSKDKREEMKLYLEKRNMLRAQFKTVRGDWAFHMTELLAEHPTVEPYFMFVWMLEFLIDYAFENGVALDDIECNLKEAIENHVGALR